MKLTITLSDCGMDEARRVLRALDLPSGGNESPLAIEVKESSTEGYMNQRDAASHCGTSPGTFCKYALKEGVLAERLGKDVVYKRQDVERMRNKYGSMWTRNSKGRTATLEY